MPSAVEQRIFDWGLDSAHYSGDRLDRIKSAERFGEDIIRSAEKIGHEAYSVALETGSKYENHSWVGFSTVDSVKVALDVTDFNARSQVRPHIHVGAALTPIREWEGYVEHIGEDTFFVKIFDVSQGSGVPTEEAEFELRELSGFDRSNLRVGSIIRWVIGFERLPSDQRRKVSRVHVRRLPVFSVEDVEVAYRDASELLAGIVIDEYT